MFGNSCCVDQVHNSDGVWLRLNPDCLQRYCTAASSTNKVRHTEAWVLQYNQHLGKTLLVAQEELPPSMDQVPRLQLTCVQIAKLLDTGAATDICVQVAKLLETGTADVCTGSKVICYGISL